MHLIKRSQCCQIRLLSLCTNCSALDSLHLAKSLEEADLMSDLTDGSNHVDDVMIAGRPLKDFSKLAQ